MTSKAAKCLWFLKKLKRSGVSQADLVYYYQAVIRPVLEYACPIWLTSITGQQSKHLDSIQRRACQIILNDRTHSGTCTVLGLPSLHDRRHKQCQRLFQQLARITDKWQLLALFPDMRDSIIIPPPRRKGGIIKRAAVSVCPPVCLSVRLSVPCLNITRERKGLVSPNLTGLKPITRVTREPI